MDVPFADPPQGACAVDWDSYWAGHDRDASARQQHAAWSAMQREMNQQRRTRDRALAEWSRRGSWDPIRSTTAPRLMRLTRTSRTTTGRRVARMTASASRSSGDDGPDGEHEPPPSGRQQHAQAVAR